MWEMASILPFKWVGSMSLLICDHFETLGTAHCEIFTFRDCNDFCEEQEAASLKLCKLEWPQLPNSDLGAGLLYYWIKQLFELFVSLLWLNTWKKKLKDWGFIFDYGRGYSPQSLKAQQSILEDICITYALHISTWWRFLLILHLVYSE